MKTLEKHIRHFFLFLMSFRKRLWNIYLENFFELKSYSPLKSHLILSASTLIKFPLKRQRARKTGWGEGEKTFGPFSVGIVANNRIQSEFIKSDFLELEFLGILGFNYLQSSVWALNRKLIIFMWGRFRKSSFLNWSWANCCCKLPWNTLILVTQH